MTDCEARSTPAQYGVKLSKSMIPQDQTEEIDMAKVPYKGAVGSLVYAMVGTRPDIAAAVGAVSRFMANPGQAHWRAMKHIFRYLQGTSDRGITFSGSTGNVTLEGYCDADWGNQTDDRRSITGYFFRIARGPISWKSRTQPTVALSSSEAEYMAVTEATQEALWARLLKEQSWVSSKKGLRPSLRTIKDASHCQKVRTHAIAPNIGIRHHFIREKVKARTIALKWISTKQMIADILTKPLPKTQFKELRDALLGHTTV